MKEQILSMLRAKDTGKAAYAESDRLLDEIIKTLKPGERVDLGEGAIAELVDNFAVKNKSWKPCGISRFEIKVSRGSFVPAAPAQSPNPAAVSPPAAPAGPQKTEASSKPANVLAKTPTKKKSPKPSALSLRIRAHEQDAKNKR